MMSADPRDTAARVDANGTKFRSILFDRPEDAARVHAVDEPDFFRDLNLDLLLTSLTAGRDQYRLEPFFFVPLRHVSAVDYRHELLRDLEKPDVRLSVGRFARSMQRMREHLTQVEKLHYPLQKQSWFLDAAVIYCLAVRAFRDDLAECDLSSRGLRGLRDYLTTYIHSQQFTSLADEGAALKDALAEVRYAVRSNGPRVTVTRYAGEPDYSMEVTETFARFQQGAVSDYLGKLRNHSDMNHVEAQILEGVARLYPDVFGQRTDFCARNNNYLDTTIGQFDREVQFYLAYLDLVDRCRNAGLPFCYPHVSGRSKTIAAEEAFDIALADKLLSGTGGPVVVPNDFRLDGQERMLVVTGPNNGGKTTFARMFAQLHYLASLGLPVPGRKARLLLPDQIFTHFERAEDIETLRGKFDDELVRVRGILERASPSSLIVMNESFSSTSLSDALFVGAEVLRQILDLDCLGVYVTFVDELASLSEATVSMVSQIDPRDAAKRTYKVIRRPADGRAYAWAIAKKYGLSYERLIERIEA